MGRKLLIELDQEELGCASIALDRFHNDHDWDSKEVDAFDRARILFDELYRKYHALPPALKEIRSGSD